MTGQELIEELQRLPADQREQPILVKDRDGMWIRLSYVQPNRSPYNSKEANGNYITLL